MAQSPRPGTLSVIPRETQAACVRLVAIVCGIYAVLRILGFDRLFPDDTGGIGAILAILGTLYSVLYAFATYVIWGQFTAVESQIQHEASALTRPAYLQPLPPREGARTHRALVKNYARGVLETEWRALSHGEDSENTARAFPQIHIERHLA